MKSKGARCILHSSFFILHLLEEKSSMSQAPSEGLRLQKEGIPEGLWMRCPECGDMLFRKVVDEALHVCPGCQYHFRVSARVRIEQICDPGTFEERFTDIFPAHRREFVDKKAYS